MVSFRLILPVLLMLLYMRRFWLRCMLVFSHGNIPAMIEVDVRLAGGVNQQAALQKQPLYNMFCNFMLVASYLGFRATWKASDRSADMHTQQEYTSALLLHGTARASDLISLCLRQVQPVRAAPRVLFDTKHEEPVISICTSIVVRYS